MSIGTRVWDSVGNLQEQVQHLQAYLNPPAAPQAEDSWIVSVSERAGQVAGMFIGGTVGACLGLGTHLAANYSKLDAKAIKEVETSGEIVGVVSTAILGVVSGISIDHLLQSEGAIIWALATSLLAYYMMGSYAKVTGKVLVGVGVRVQGLVLGTLAGTFQKAKNLGTIGLEAGGVVGRLVGQIPSKLGSRKADELIGEVNADWGPLKQGAHLVAHSLVKHVSAVALLGISSLAIDTQIMNIGLSEALMLSLGIEAWKKIIKISVDKAGLQAETINKINTLSIPSFVMGVYGTGLLEGGWTGFFVRGGLSASYMALNLAWNNASLIWQTAFFGARFLCAFAAGYASLVLENPVLIIPSIVLGAVIARLYSGQNKVPAVPQQAAAVVVPPVLVGAVNP